MDIKEGDPVTVHYPEELRDGTVVSWRLCPDLVDNTWCRKYTILFDDDESADPAVHEIHVEPRGQGALL